MRKNCLVFLVLVFSFLICQANFAQTDSALTEVSGVLEVTPPDTENNAGVTTLIIDAGEAAYKLVVENAAMLEEMIKADGKSVSVQGTVTPSKEEYVMDELKVASWQLIPDAVEEIQEVEEAPAADEEIIMDGE